MSLWLSMIPCAFFGTDQTSKVGRAAELLTVKTLICANCVRHNRIKSARERETYTVWLLQL